MTTIRVSKKLLPAIACGSTLRVGKAGCFMAYVQRNTSKTNHSSGGGGFPRTVEAETYPALCEYLCLEKWEDGKPRETSTLLLFVSNGSLTAALNDRDNGQTLWVADDSFLDVLAGLERLLESGEGVWRRNQATRGKGNKK